MSDSQAYEEVQTSSDGVAVTKRFEEDEFPVPAIAFEFVSDRDETVTVTLSDEVPESVAVEDLGFHPEYGSEHWTIDEDRITFEYELDAEDEYTTVYGIRATGTDDVEQFLTEPAIENVDPPLSDDETGGALADDIVPESDGDVVKDAIAGDGDVPGLEDEDDSDEEEEEDIGTLNLKDPNQPGAEQTASSTEEPEPESDEDTAPEEETETDEETEPDVEADTDTGPETDTEDTDEEPEADTETEEDAEVTVEGGSVIQAMAAEIRQDDVPVEDLKLVTQAIDELSTRERGTGDGTHDARVETLQKDVADLRAYTDALEEFLDENGTGQQLIEEFESQLDQFSSSLESVETSLEDTTGTVEEVDTEVDAISEDISAVSEDVESVESTVADLEDTVAELEAEVTEGDVAVRIDEMEEQLEDLREWQDQIKSTFGG